MRIIAKSTLDAYGKRHADAGAPLLEWYLTVSKKEYVNLVELRVDFSHADLCGENNKLTCFNIKGNKYRLVTHTIYKIQTMYIRDILTHAEYDKKYVDKRKRK